MREKIIIIAAILANLALIAFALILTSKGHGSDARMAWLFLIPSVLSLLAILQMEDTETRRLKKQVRKASLRKELKELEAFVK